MRTYLVSVVAMAIANAGAAKAQAINDVELSPVLQGKVTSYLTCLREIDGRLRSSRVTPERYQMAMDGACLVQSEEVNREMKAHLDSIPHPGVSFEAAEATSTKTLGMIRSADERRRKAYVSSYVLWFALPESSNGKPAR